MLLTRRSSPERTLESLYRRHVDDVYRYALAMLDRQADAEDAAQTTFLNAYKALEHGERPRNPEKWLRSIALNVCREHYRRAGRRPDEVSLDYDPGELVLEPPSIELGEVLRGMSVLPFNQRSALVMREFEGRSLKQIAKQLEVSIPAVETLLFRARRALREQLEGILTCIQAEEAISRQLDGALPRGERGLLRAHLRACPECAKLARRMRAQRGAMRSLALALPLPFSLSLRKLLDGGGLPAQAVTASSGAGFAALGGKLVGLTLAGAALVGGGFVSLRADRPHHGLSGRSQHVGLATSRPPAHGAAALGVSIATALNAQARRSASAGARTGPGRSTGAVGHQAGKATNSTPNRGSVGTARGSSSTNPGQGHAYAYGRTTPEHGHAYGTGKSRGRGHTKTSPATSAPRPGRSHGYGSGGPPVTVAPHPPGAPSAPRRATRVRRRRVRPAATLRPA